MQSNIIYVELKSGYSDNGPAWIGKCFFSKTRQTVYFNGQVFKKENGISGNYFDIESWDEYWISGVKKDGTDRHKFGGGIIQIDESIIGDYLKIIRRDTLPKSKFQIVQLNNIPAKHITIEMENQKSELSFDDSIRFKNPKDLSTTELSELINYYEELDLPGIHKKARKDFIQILNEMKAEFEKRKL